MKWSILDKVRAEKLKLKILKPDCNNFLEVNITAIPKGMSTAEFIDFIKRTGIVLSDESIEDAIPDIEYVEG